MIKKHLLMFLILLIFSISMLGCSNSKDINKKANPEQLTQEVINLLLEESYDDIHTYFDEELQEKMPVEKLEDFWKDHIQEAGEFYSVESLAPSNRSSSYTAVEAELVYSQVIFQSRFVFNDKKKIVSIHFTDGYANADKPESVTEKEVVIGEGSAYELAGTLTLPKDYNGELPAVVLVHGSGPSDRDEAVYAYRPFRDIAWGLASQGIAVLRYDKRTFVYGNNMTREYGNTLTVKEETVDDAILATNLLKADSRIDPEKVFLVGHSLGGMLAPRIDEVGANAAGLVILAGSVRPLWEIIYDQNIALLRSEEMDEAAVQENIAILDQEWEKAVNIMELTDAEAKQETIFGLPAFYFKDMDRYNTKEAVAELEKPMFILQGENDFQVFMDKDFLLWQEIVKQKENATLRSYPGLNHFFIHYEGDDKGTVAEYAHPNVVDENVIGDIANWILEQADL